MSVESQKSLKLNMAFSAVNSIVSILVPLITFPYASRVLGVERIGQYNFSHTMVNYFILLSGLGIGRYAVREGSALREDKAKINRFANEMFTINMLATLASYALLIVLALAYPGMRPYWMLLFILSFQIIFNTVGIDWINSIYEDYQYIAVRGTIIQLISLILVFILIRTAGDLNRYAVITVLSSAGLSILNFVHARKYIRLGFTRTVDWKRHMKPIFILFAMALTQSIYVSSDVTVLGILCGDKAVGIYSASTKIYTGMKNLLSTILVVSIPRLSAQFGTGRLTDFRKTAQDIYATLITAMLPAITGIIILSRPFVQLAFGPEFAEASRPLAILGVALFMCMGSWFWGQCVLIPMKRESEVFKATVISAVLNLILNLILIPKWQENAAAFTTLLAEGAVFLWSMMRAKSMSGVTGEGKIYLKVAAGCAGIVMVNVIARRLFMNDIVYVLATIALSVAVYSAIEVLIKNEAIYSLVNEIKNRKGRGQI